MIFGALLGAASLIGKGIGAISTAVKAARAKPIVKIAAAAATGIAGMGAVNAISNRQTGLVPYTGGAGGLPQLPGLSTTGGLQPVGGLPIGWKGPGGKLQMPWNDPRVPEYLKQFALDDAYLKVFYRAPKGYVVVKDLQGRAFAVNKAIAKQFGLWHSKPKPPISVKDWHSFQRAKSVEKKLRKIAGPALRRNAPRACKTTKKGR